MTGLQQHPPPIDYPAHRAIGQNLDLLSAAVEAGRRRHPTTVPTQTLQRQLWERLTGGDIAYAPLPIGIGYTSPDYRTSVACTVSESPTWSTSHTTASRRRTTSPGR